MRAAFSLLAPFLRRASYCSSSFTLEPWFLAMISSSRRRLLVDPGNTPEAAISDVRLAISRRRRASAGDLDEVAARVVEHGGGDRAHGRRRLGEADAERDQTLVLGDDVVGGERRERDAIGHECFLEGSGGGVLVRLEDELHAVTVIGRHHGQPRVVANGNVRLLHEPEYLGIEAKGFRLVVDEDAGQVNLHWLSSLVVPCLSMPARCTRAATDTS